MTSFIEFMKEREKLIDRGLIGHNRAIVTKLNIELASKRIPGFRAIAGNVSRSDKSDPFLYDRVMSHLKNGTTLPHEYSVEWGNEKKENIFAIKLEPLSAINQLIANANCHEKLHFNTLVAHKMKVPCL